MLEVAAASKFIYSPRVRAPLQAVALTSGFIALAFTLKTVAPGLNPALTGFAVVLVALSARILPLSMIEDGAKYLIAQSALFLIPPVVAVARQSALLEAHWMPLLVIVVGGTALSAAATAVAVELTSRMISRRLS